MYQLFSCRVMSRWFWSNTDTPVRSSSSSILSAWIASEVPAKMATALCAQKPEERREGKLRVEHSVLAVLLAHVLLLRLPLGLLLAVLLEKILQGLCFFARNAGLGQFFDESLFVWCHLATSCFIAVVQDARSPCGLFSREFLPCRASTACWPDIFQCPARRLKRYLPPWP